MKINILGTEYEVIDNAFNDDYPKLQELDGYCSFTTKKVVVAAFEQELGTDEDVGVVRNQVMRHELTHAFLSESGMEEWSQNEKLVNWIAIQFPKLQKAFIEADCL